MVICHAQNFSCFRVVEIQWDSPLLPKVILLRVRPRLPPGCEFAALLRAWREVLKLRSKDLAELVKPKGIGSNDKPMPSSFLNFKCFDKSIADVSYIGNRNVYFRSSWHEFHDKSHHKSRYEGLLLDTRAESLARVDSTEFELLIFGKFINEVPSILLSQSLCSFIRRSSCWDISPCFGRVEFLDFFCLENSGQ